MFKTLFGLKQSNRQAHVLYGAVVARARDAEFFQKFGVPDTFDGRFEMLTMHLFLIHNRMKNEDTATREISQKVFDHFINDMDSALREAGVGDPSVPKRIAKMMRVFYGRTGAYETALANSNSQNGLEAVIKRNLFPDGESNGKEIALATYMQMQIDHLKKMTAEEIIKNQTVYAAFNSTDNTASLD